jgi:hypothetical protein
MLEGQQALGIFKVVQTMGWVPSDSYNAGMGLLLVWLHEKHFGPDNLGHRRGALLSPQAKTD